MANGCGRRFAAGVALSIPLIVNAQPAVVPAEAIAVCNEVFVRMADTAGAKVTRQSELIREEMIAKPFPGCRIRIDGSRERLGDATMPTTVLDQFFEQHRWSQLTEFSADGHDGTVFGYARAKVGCLVRGEWDGGSDDQPDAPAADPYVVTVICGDRASFMRPQ